jgi:hypothetical protein
MAYFQVRVNRKDGLRRAKAVKAGVVERISKYGSPQLASTTIPQIREAQRLNGGEVQVESRAGSST